VAETREALKWELMDALGGGNERRHYLSS
jgi:hypothetical protein